VQQKIPVQRLPNDVIRIATHREQWRLRFLHRHHRDSHPRDASACFSIGEMYLQETSIRREIELKFFFPVFWSFEKLQSTNLAPISAGAIDVHADVDLTYELSPAGKPAASPRSASKK